MKPVCRHINSEAPMRTVTNATQRNALEQSVGRTSTAEHKL